MLFKLQAPTFEQQSAGFKLQALTGEPKFLGMGKVSLPGIVNKGTCKLVG